MLFLLPALTLRYGIAQMRDKIAKKSHIPFVNTEPGPQHSPCRSRVLFPL